jgi:hypothetical protein
VVLPDSFCAVPSWELDAISGKALHGSSRRTVGDLEKNENTHEKHSSRDGIPFGLCVSII